METKLKPKIKMKCFVELIDKEGKVVKRVETDSVKIVEVKKDNDSNDDAN